MKKVFILALIVAITGITIYFIIGGGQPLKFEKRVEDITIYGKSYQGHVKSNELENLFDESRKLAIELNTPLAIINYPLEVEDSVKQFIGVAYSDTLDMMSIELKEVTFLIVTLDQNPVVMPTPEEVSEDAADFAEENDLKLESFTIELYTPNGLTVMFPMRAF